MTISLHYATFKQIFKHNSFLVYVVSGTDIVNTAPLSAGGEGNTVYGLVDDPPTQESTFTNDFPAALKVLSIG